MQLRSWILLLLLVGCAGPVLKEPTKVEKIKIDNARGQRLSQELEPKLKIRQDAETYAYLRQLAQSIANKSGDLSLAQVGVAVISDRDAQWRSYGLPGNRVYLSRSMLGKLEYEAEVAAAIALEFGHISKRHALLRLESKATAEGRDPPVETPVEFFGSGGLFAYTEAELLEAVDAAVEILYRAGVDPRGLVSLFQVYGQNPKNSPFDTESLSKLEGRARRDVAEFTPLRNPLVRSEAFLRIQKRIRNL